MIGLAGFAVFGEEAPRSRTWEAGTYVYYASGDYGRDDETKIFYWPAVVRLHTGDWKYTLTVPYISIRSSGRATVVDGSPEVIEAEDGETEEQDGLGDIVLKASYDAVRQGRYVPWISLYGRLKLPTADENKGLGTGEPDVGFGIEAVRVFENRYVLFAEAGYKFVGEPSGADYDNQRSFSVGLGRYVTDALLLAGFYEWRDAISAGGTDPEELTFLASHRLTGDLRTFAMFDIGLSDGAADYGVAAGFNLRF